MRIAVTSTFRHLAGGVEVYLNNVLPALARRGCDVQLWHEYDPPEGAQLLASPVAHSCARLGLEKAQSSMRAWQPDLIFDQGLENVTWEETLQDVAPVVHFLHAYHGACISGNKSWQFPRPRPCGRPLGPGCLLHYYPHRCGGLNPLTMLRSYRTQTSRLENLRSFSSIVTASEHMRQEMLNHGFPPDRVGRVGLYLPRQATSRPRTEASQTPSRLLFSGRMVAQKGGLLLIEASELASRRLGRKLFVTLAGDGPDRKLWEAKASRLQSLSPLCQFQFTGWLDREHMLECYATHDLVVAPSIWPEPFGVVCVEAAQHGLPVAAFDVGGIADSLEDGVNGRLAPSSPPTAEGLADAIAGCIGEIEVYAKLCAGASRRAAENDPEEHLRRLTDVFENARRQSTPR